MSSLCERIVAVNAGGRFGQEGIEKMLKRLGQPARNLVGPGQMQIPGVFGGRKLLSVGPAAETVHAIDAVQEERRVLTLLGPAADHISIQAEDGSRQGLHVIAASGRRLAEVLGNDQAAAIAGDRDDLLKTGAAGIDELKGRVLVQRRIDVSGGIVRGQSGSLWLSHPRKAGYKRQQYDVSERMCQALLRASRVGKSPAFARPCSYIGTSRKRVQGSTDGPQTASAGTQIPSGSNKRES